MTIGLNYLDFLEGISSMKRGWVYILECNDSSYYTGVTSDLSKRYHQHKAGIASQYTKSRLPLKLLFAQEFNSIEEAINAEKQIKGWRREKKKALIVGDYQLLQKLSKNYKKNISINDKSKSP